MPPRFRRARAPMPRMDGATSWTRLPTGSSIAHRRAAARRSFRNLQLLNENRVGRGGRMARRDLLYGRVKQARAYALYKGKLDRTASEQLLTKVERVKPGILDFNRLLGRDAGRDGIGNRIRGRAVRSSNAARYSTAPSRRPGRPWLRALSARRPTFWSRPAGWATYLIRAMARQGPGKPFRVFRGISPDGGGNNPAGNNLLQCNKFFLTTRRLIPR